MGKLVKCKSCGKEIAKSANRCPSCGARQHQGVYAACAFIVAVSIIAMIPILGRGDDTNSSSVSSVSVQSSIPPQASTEPIVTVSAHDLYKAYSDNAINADNLYKDKIVAVTGTISNIGQDLISKAPCISLESGDSLGAFPIQCFFPKNGKDSDKIATLKDGDTITLYGTCTGFQVAYVQLSTCYLSD